MLNINEYKELFVEEHEKKYLIRCVNVHNRVVKFEFNKSEEDKRRVMDLIYSFLNTFLINGFNNSRSIYNGSLDNNSMADILLCNNGMKISLKTDTKEFKAISNFILERYLANRDEFFNSNDINNIVINALSSGSAFSVVDNVVHLTVGADLNMNIPVSERNFIREFIRSKCSSRKIDIEFIRDENGHKELYIATSGEFKMVFPAGYTYSTILGMITNHNEEITESRRRR